MSNFIEVTAVLKRRAETEERTEKRLINIDLIERVIEDRGKPERAIICFAGWAFGGAKKEVGSRSVLPVAQSYAEICEAILSVTR